MQTLAFRLAFAGNSLLLIFVISVLFDIFPFRLIDPVWLSSTTDVLIQNSVFALVGIILLCFSTYFDPDNVPLVSHQRRILQLCCVISVCFLLLIPLQFFVASQIVSGLNRQEFYKFELSVKRLKFFSQKVQQVDTFDQLQQVMKTYQSVQLPEAERSKPLQLTKTLLLNKINEALAMLKNSRNPFQLKSKSWQQYKLAMRNSLFSFTYFLAFASLSQRRNSQRSWLQEIMEGFLNLLYGVLHRRETQLATQVEVHEDSKLALPLTPQQLDKLHQQGLMDQGWLPDQSSGVSAGDEILPDDQISNAPNNDFWPSNEPPSRARGLFSWLRRRDRRWQDDPTSFLETLADQHTVEQPDFSDRPSSSDVTPNHPSETHSTDEQLKQPQRRPGSSSLRRHNITDLDYFEQLAEDQDGQHDVNDHQTKPPSLL